MTWPDSILASIARECLGIATDQAAAIARRLPTEDAASIDDCDGDTFAALVDVDGDDEHEKSVLVDFEPEKQRKAADKEAS